MTWIGSLFFLHIMTHIQAAHIKSLYRCDQCSYERRTFILVQSHIHSSHGFPTNLEIPERQELTRLHVRHKCNVCGFELADSEKDKMLEHMEVNHKSHLLKIESYRQCDKCYFSSSTRKKLRAHKKNVHPDLAMQSLHKCSLCAYHTNVKFNFFMHMEKHLGSVYLCNQCEYQSKDRRVLLRHIKHQHKDGNEDNQTIDQMTCRCSPCNIQTLGSKYTDHMTQVHEFPLQDKRFSNDSKAKHSVHGDHVNYLHKCTSCNFGSNTKLKFTSHFHKHLGTIYQCKICDFKTEYRTQMISHSRDQHRKEYRERNSWTLNNVIWKCSTCNLQTDGKEYKIHMINIHNFNIKDRRFSKAKRSNIPNRRKLFPLTCPECKYGTKLLSNLRAHMYTHMGIYFSCNLCEETSKLRGIILNHVMEKHKQQVRLDPNNWIAKHVLCHCTSCDVSLSSVELDEHLVKIHIFPIKIKAPISQTNIKSVQAPSKETVTTVTTRSQKDIGLMLKLAQLPIAVNLT